MEALRKEEFYTIEDIYDLPDGERAELIDGRIYYMAPPNTRHQMLVMNLSYQIKDYINRKKGKCQVFPAPFAVFLNEDDINYVEPDISVICDKNKITEKGLSPPAVSRWIISQSYLNTGRLALGNIGLLTLQRMLLWCIDLKGRSWSNIRLGRTYRLGFMKTFP